MPDSQLSTLPTDFLSSPAPNITISRIDFKKANLSAYDGCYAVIIDNVLSSTECSQLIAAAEATSNSHWERALINVGSGRQQLIADSRNCGRIIWDSQEVVDRIWKRVAHLPEVREIVRLEDVPKMFGIGPQKRGEVWEFTRPNERMRFLKYVGGEYFRPHCDGSYETASREERTYFTLHLYLNNSGAKGSKGDLVGGATRFHSYPSMEKKEAILDVLPKTGRILLFQHRNLLHSGDDVVQGVKYTMRTDLLYSLTSSKSGTKSKMPALDD